MKISFWEWVKYALDIKKPSDYFVYTGFGIIALAAITCWCGLLVQMFQTQPTLAVFMSVISVGFIILFIGLGLYQKGS